MHIEIVRSIGATYINFIKLRPHIVTSPSLNSLNVNALQFLWLLTFFPLVIIFDFARLFYFSRCSISQDYIFPFIVWRNRISVEIEHLAKSNILRNRISPSNRRLCQILRLMLKGLHNIAQAVLVVRKYQFWNYCQEDYIPSWHLW